MMYILRNNNLVILCMYINFMCFFVSQTLTLLCITPNLIVYVYNMPYSKDTKYTLINYSQTSMALGTIENLL